MTKDKIMQMAREAGMQRQCHNLASNPVQYRYSYDGSEESLERFFHMAQAAEREACSKLADEADKYNRHISREIAAAIRARGQTEKQQIQSSVREAIDEFGPERFAKAHAEPVQGHDWQERLKELQIVFKDVDQSGPLLGMGGKKIGCVNHDCDKCQTIKQAEKQEPKKWVEVKCPLCGEMAVAHTHPNLNKREWIGLTDEDKHYLNEALNLQGRFPIIDAIEAKLRKKNA